MQNGGAAWTIQAIDGSSVDLSYIYYRAGSAWLNPQDNEDGDWYDYYAEMFVWASGAAGWSDCHYMTFYFDETPEGSAAVTKVEIDEAAPAVYYNLQGQKVANPSKGLYIVRQGKNVKKVMMK